MIQISPSPGRSDLETCATLLRQFQVDSDPFTKLRWRELIELSQLPRHGTQDLEHFIDEAHPPLVPLCFKPSATLRPFDELYKEMVADARRPALHYPSTVSDRLKQLGGDAWIWVKSNNPIGLKIVSDASAVPPAMHRLHNRLLTKYRRTVPLLGVLQFYRDLQKLPKSLEALAPDYLTAVPLDPYDGRAGSLRARKTPAIFSRQRRSR